MADSYRNDQYYNIGVANENTNFESNSSGYYSTGDSSYSGHINKKFIYPNREIREIGRYNPNGSTRLSRGYIRSLNDMVSPNAKTVKCQFQFNPEAIQHAVSQNQQIRNFLLMSPEDMSQPIPGSTQFSFDLFFDRTMEFNNPRVGDALNTEFAWEASSPSQVGVLHDIGILYSVIGVGLSRATQSFARDVYTQQINAQTPVDKTTSNTESSQDEEDQEEDVITTDVSADTASALSNLETLLSVNVGNAAFLLPFPIRTVFSSLYIVEGFVTSIRTVFTKFSRTMVPLQVAVNLQVDAKYVGFARESTFLTESLRGAYEETIRTDYEVPAEIGGLGQHDFYKVVLSLNDWQYQRQNPNADTAPTSGDGVIALSDLVDRDRVYAHFFVKDLQAVTDANPAQQASIGTTYEGGLIGKAFAEGGNPYVEVDGSVAVYAYSPDAKDWFDSVISSTHSDQSSNVLLDYLQDRSSTESTVNSYNKVNGGTGKWPVPSSSLELDHLFKIVDIPSISSGQNTTASTLDEWEKIYKDHNTYSDGVLPSSEVGTGNVATRNVLHEYYWWAYEFTGKVTVQKDGQSQTSELRKCWSQQYDGQGPGTKYVNTSLPEQYVSATVSFDFLSGLAPTPDSPFGSGSDSANGSEEDPPEFRP